MNPSRKFKLFRRFQFTLKTAQAVVMVVVCLVLMSACGGSDAEPKVRKFCAQVKAGESIMKVVARAGKVDFDKYWLEKFNKDPSKGENIGIIRPRDLEKKTEKLEKLKHPREWNHGKFKAMIQELGYSRHVCSADFARGKVVKKEVLSFD